MNEDFSRSRKYWHSANNFQSAFRAAKQFLCFEDEKIFAADKYRKISILVVEKLFSLAEPSVNHMIRQLVLILIDTFL